MTTLTLSDVETQFGLTHLDHLERDATIPVVTDLGFQGDVAVIRSDTRREATTPVPAAGFPVVRGENGGNTHLLVGEATFDAHAERDDTDLLLGHVTVQPGATALLSHPEHGGLLLAAGTYEIRRQREQADQIRRVTD